MIVSPHDEMQLTVAAVMARFVHRTRKPLRPKGTRVWRDRAHRTEVRNAERRVAKERARRG